MNSNETLQFVCQIIIICIQVIALISTLSKNANSVDSSDSKTAGIIGTFIGFSLVVFIFWTAGAYSLIFP